MTVKIVTDSCSDIPQEEAKQLGISVVPVYVRFGDEVYRDGVDIDSREFYHKLVTSSVHLSTAAPSPGDFVKVYEEAAQKTDEIVSMWFELTASMTRAKVLSRILCLPYFLSVRKQTATLLEMGYALPTVHHL